jgi:hypothetical protein
MKKTFLLFLILILIALVGCMPTATNSTEIPASATPIPATEVPTATATTLAPAFSGTEISYGPLTIVVPPEVANGASGIEMPRIDGEEVALWQKTPGHWQINLGDYYILQGKSIQPQIYVYPAMAYAELVPGAFESVRRLDNILYSPGGPSLSADQLPTVPFFNAQQVFTSNAQVISFQNGAGVRFLTEYAQYPASANNQDLFYNFQGVSRDGAYYIVAIFPITVPVLAETSDGGATLPPGGIPYSYFAEGSNFDAKAYYTAVTDLLNSASPESFTPNINQLDALIQSMQITP